ncbi:sirohydrochlorin chelatase [Halobacillus sp. Marseille-P3879]|uniref:sirohydrochlorin chelatase n=1 Tax=Halobacillus sp. Marseille-P3879 TaxID=2045014 RepID=UPI000C7CDA8E|nr:sirohydrochlorin chelatase [Halobacillus sp. Marseille-P3879]
MQAVLYVGHGSRMEEAVTEAAAFMKETMKKIDYPIQEYCFLELASPSILEGIEICVQEGASKIAVVPVLLLSAGHAKTDIPEEIDKASHYYPEIEFTYGCPLGVHPMMIDILVERMIETNPITTDMDIVIVARGSRDPDTVRDVKSIAHSLKRKLGVNSIEYCFLTAAHPRFEVKLKEMVTGGRKHVIILPYLLFTGILINEMKRYVNTLPLQSYQRVDMGNYLNGHPNLNRLLKKRIQEAVKM